MNQEDISKAKNPDLRNSLIAMRRAREMAIEIAIQTNTAIVLFIDGKVVRIPADQLRERKE